MPSIDNKKKSQQNKLLYIFLTAFFVTLVTLIYLATAFTPDIDVDVNTDEPETTTVDRQDIDGRLKAIQQEEMLSISPNRPDNQSSSEIFEQLKKMKEEALSKQAEEEIQIQTTEQKPVPQPTQNVQKPNLAVPTYTRQAAVPAKMAKVYVGRYSDFDQAIKVQDALIQSSYASAPFVKNLGGYYVIQVGSFSNAQTAQNAVEQLIAAGYQARMVLE